MILRPVLYILPLTLTVTAALAEERVKCPKITQEQITDIQSTKKYTPEGDDQTVWTFHKQGGQDLNIATSIETLSVEPKNGECTYQAIFDPEDFEGGDDGNQDVGTYEPVRFERFTLKLDATTAPAKKQD